MLRDDGIMFLNIGDTFNGNKEGNTNSKWESVNNKEFTKKKDLPPGWCPINDPLPEGWSAPVTILPEGYLDTACKRIENEQRQGKLW